MNNLIKVLLILAILLPFTCNSQDDTVGNAASVESVEKRFNSVASDYYDQLKTLESMRKTYKNPTKPKFLKLEKQKVLVDALHTKMFWAAKALQDSLGEEQ